MNDQIIQAFRSALETDPSIPKENAERALAFLGRTIGGGEHRTIPFKDAARMLGVSMNTLRHYICKGLVRPVRAPGAKYAKAVDAASLDAFVAGRRA